MKKMKKSALAAAVLLSLSMMGSAYAEENLWSEPINISGDTWDLSQQSGGPYTGVYINTVGGYVITSSQDATIKMVTDGNITLSGYRLFYAVQGTEITYNSEFQGKNITINCSKDCYYDAGVHTLDAETITLNAGSGFALCAKSGKIKLNEKNKTGTVTITSGVDSSTSAAIYPVKGGEVDIYGNRVVVENTKKGGAGGAIRTAGGNIVNIVQTGNGNDDGVYLKSDAYGMCAYGGTIDINATKVDVKSGGNGIELNSDGEVNIAADSVNVLSGKCGIKTASGTVDVKIRANDISISSTGEYESEKSGYSLCLYGGSATLEGQQVTLNGVVYGRVKDSTDEQLTIISPKIDINAGNSERESIYVRNAEYSLSIKGDGQQDTIVNVKTADKQSFGTIKNSGSILLDGNGKALTWNSGEIITESSGANINIIGNVVMHVPSIANQVNVGVADDPDTVGVNEAKIGNLTFDMVDEDGTGTLKLTNKTNSLNVVNGTVSLNVDLDLSGTNISGDNMTIQKLLSQTKISLNKVNVLADANVNYSDKIFQLVTVNSGVNNLTIAGTKVATDKAIYTINGSTGTGKISVNCSVLAGGVTLSSIVKDGSINSYSFSSDIEADDNLGALADPDTPEGAKRELTIDGNDHEIDGNGKAGVTVSEGQILNLINLTMNGFSGNAVTNNGTLNTEGTVNIKSDVTGTGNMNVSGTTTVAGNLEQGNLTFSEGATVKVGKNLFSDTVTAIGSNNIMGAAHTYALGEDNKVMGEKSVAVGFANEVNGKGSGAFGDPNVVYGDGSYAFGNDNKIGTADKHADNSYAVGNNNTVSGNNSFALGNGTNVSGNGSVALGNGSTATEDNVVSVGSETQQRKIVNVKAGEADTDAVNYGQLKTATNMGATAGNYYAANDSVVTAIGKVDTQVKTNTTAIATLQNAVGGTDGGLVKDVTDIQKYVKEDGLDANNKKVTNVADGTVAEGSKEAVNGGQLYKVDKKVEGIIGGDITDLKNDVSNLNGRVDRLGNRIDKVGAGAAALAALHPLDFDPENKLSFSAGVGNYRGEKAAAVGMFYRPTDRVMFSVAGTMGDDNNMVNAGISFALDRKVKLSNGLESPQLGKASRETLVNEVQLLTAENTKLNDKVKNLDDKVAKLMKMIEEMKNK